MFPQSGNQGPACHMVPSKKERKSKNQNQILKFNKKITNYLIYSFKGKVKKSLLDSGTRDWETTGEKGKKVKENKANSGDKIIQDVIEDIPETGVSRFKGSTEYPVQ